MMSRVDIPTLRCDRCGHRTQDVIEMGKFDQLTGRWHGYGSTQARWDLCPQCIEAFKIFMDVEQ